MKHKYKIITAILFIAVLFTLSIIETNDVISFNISQNIKAEKNKTWNALSDIGNIADFHPNIEKSYIIGDKKQGLGTQAIWKFYEKGEVTEEITQFTEGESFAVELIEGTIPVTYAETIFTVKKIQDEKTQVDIVMNFKMKFGILGAVMGNIIVKDKMQERMDNFLDSLETYLESGKKIAKNGVTGTGE